MTDKKFCVTINLYKTADEVIMGLWDKIFSRTDEKLAQWQEEGAQNTHLDLRLREGISLLASGAINRFVPHQDDSALSQNLVGDVVNTVMSDYDGSLRKDQIFARVNKDFLPQPSMLAHWAEEKGFQKIQQKDNALSSKDVADKYVLTYYPPAARSWAKRTTDNLQDTTNKHWYSHAKSSLYDSAGHPIGSANPEAFYNDTAHDATAYVPEDSVSYAIDYKKLGLKKEDIAEGFKFQSEGMNIMEPKIQESVFRLQNAGLSNDDIVRLWRANTDITNEENLTKIENTLKKSKNKEDIFALDYVESNNAYRYNLQDRSCAVQPTAPLLYATSARIKREDLDTEQADKLRQKVGLYNFYDEKNYGEINKKFYTSYENKVMGNFKEALIDDAKKLIKQPRETLTELGKNVANATKWLGAKTLRWAPHAIEIAYSRLQYHEQQARHALVQHMKFDTEKFKQVMSSLNPLRLLPAKTSDRLQENAPKQIEAKSKPTMLLPNKKDNTR